MGLETLKQVHLSILLAITLPLYVYCPHAPPSLHIIHLHTGHYGTGVLSYYIFLRWLMYLNLILFLMWTSFVIIPQAVWRSSAEGQLAYEIASAPRRTCVLQDFNASLGAVFCPRNVTVFNATTCATPTRSTFVSSECFQDGSVLREGDTVVEVARECNAANATGSLPTEWVLCLEVQPALNIGEYILWFISGEGFFNSTELFIGIYTNATIGLASSFINGETDVLWYNMPLAYLFTGGAVYIISLLAIVFRYVCVLCILCVYAIKPCVSMLCVDVCMYVVYIVR